MSLARWLLILFGVVFVSLSLAVGVADFLSLLKTQENEGRQWSDYANAVAQQIQARSQDLQQMLQGLAQDPRLVQALAAGEDLRAEEARIARILPGTLRVRILIPDLEMMTEALGFADLDLVHRAETSQPSPVVHGFGTSQSRLAVARAVKAGGQVMGVILASIDPKWLQRGFPTPTAGAIALMQGRLALIYRGDAGLKSGSPAGAMPVAGTPWEIHYWPPQGGWMDWLESALIWFCAVAVNGGVFVWGWRWMRRALEQDRETIYRLVDDLNSEVGGGSYPVVLTELQPLVRNLLQAYRSAAWVRKKAEEPPAPVSVREGEEIEGAPAPEAASEAGPEPREATSPGVSVADSIFHACDIRAPVGEALTPPVVRELGRAIGSEIQVQEEKSVVVGRDARASSEELSRALIEGLRASGSDVIDLGAVPTPLVYFATHYLTSRSAVMVTGSSSPPEYNGLKVVVGGEPWYGERLRVLQQRLLSGKLSQGMGMLESRDLLADYIGAVMDDIHIGRPLKVIVDSGAGVAGGVAPALLRTLGCEVEEVHSDGMLNPFSPGAMERLIGQVQGDDEAELGLAFDGDGDRLAVVDAGGRWVPPDRVLMLLAADVLSREPGGDVVFDIECSRSLARYVVQHGGRPVVVPAGYCHLQEKMTESDAVLGGGFGGQLMFRERWFGIHDAVYGAARLLEILSAEPLSSDELFAELPQTHATPQLIMPVSFGEEEKLMEILVASADKFFHDAKINRTDGVRVDFVDGWGMVRSSRSRPALVFRFEADDQEALARIQNYFREWFATVEMPHPLPFGETDG